MRRFFAGVLVALFFTQVYAQDDILRAALYLSGASSEEEIDEDWIQRLEAMGKVRINSNHIRPGLLTDYQIATLADYRATSGDILSWEELMLVDGFGREAVEALKPFLSLESRRLPGSVDTIRTRTEALVRSTLKNVGVKAKVTGEYWRIGGAWRSPDWTVHAEADTRVGRFVLGDFNVRYGEGLAQWSGFSMESLSTVDAFIRRSSGIAPVWSYTSSSVHRGAAYEHGGMHWRASAWGTLAKIFGAHAEYLGRCGHAGTTVAWSPAEGISASLEGRLNLRGVDGTAEVAYRSRAVAGKASARWKAGEKGKLAAQARIIPSRFSGKKNGEYALAVGYALQSGRWQFLARKSGFGSSVPSYKLSVTVDASLLPVGGVDPRRLQIRAYGNWDWQMASAWALCVRLTGRYRNYENPRTALRADIKFAHGPWLSVLRGEAVHCKALGLLTYLEGGYKNETLSSYLRFSAFSIPEWADRIYCYERDAPGTFSVPAYSGKGISASLVAGYKLRLGRFTFKANLRGAYILRVGRESAPTLNCQLQCSL
ncbi:MAG: hypothetical protein J5646_00720 [Bacteroidales bacterium]|nr:hypothetical protein [Bacteroidales bacterium]